MKTRLILFFSLMLSALGQTTFNNLTVKTNLTAGLIYGSSVNMNVTGRETYSGLDTNSVVANTLFGYSLVGTSPNITLRPNAQATKSIATLISISTDTVTTNSSVNVRGYYDTGEGGGTFYYAPFEATNTGTVFPSGNASFVWKRLLTGEPVNPKWFGARGDGITDDTAAITNSINYWLSQTNVGQYVFPQGIYRISSPIQIIPNKDILNAWSINSQGATILADSSFSGANVFSIRNSANKQLISFTMSGALTISGSTGVTDSVVLIDGSGTGIATNYTGFYKSAIKDVTVSAFGFGGTNRSDGIRVIGNFHESSFENITMSGSTGVTNQNGDGFLFEDGPNFGPAGNVGALQIVNSLISYVRYGVYQKGAMSKFSNLMLNQVHFYGTRLEAVYAKSSAPIWITSSQIEDSYTDNTNNLDFAKSAVYIEYSGVVRNLKVLGNQPTGQAKSAIRTFSTGLIAIDSVIPVGSCTKVLYSDYAVSGGVFNSLYSQSTYAANTARANHHDRVLDMIGINDVVYSIPMDYGYSYGTTNFYEFWPNLTRSSCFVVNITNLAFANPTLNIINVREPVNQVYRSDQSPTPGTPIAFSEGYRIRMTLRQNRPAALVTYLMDPVYKISSAIPALTFGNAIALEFQLYGTNWVELSRSPQWTY